MILFANGKLKQQVIPKGMGNEKFSLIKRWMQKYDIILNIWGIDNQGKAELYNRNGQPLGGLAVKLNEITVTGNVEPINLPGNVKPGWVAKQGGSMRGILGSKALGYELTPLGKKQFDQEKQDPVK